MGKSSGGGSTTQTTQPWIGQQPYLEDLFSQSQNLYQNQQPQFFPDATYIPFSGQTQQGLDATMQRAQGSQTEGAFNQYLQGALNQPQVDPSGSVAGANQLMGGIAPGMGGMLGQMAGGGYGGAQDFVGAGMQGGIGGLNTLGQTAEGNFLGSNPFLDSQIDIAQRRMMDTMIPETNATFGLAGRTGSGMHADVLGERLAQGLGDVETQMRGQAYEAERGRQQQAAGQLGSLGLGSGQLGGSLFEAGQGRALQAGQTLGDWGMGGIGASNDIFGNISLDQARAGAFAPEASQMDWQNIDRILGAGGMVEGQASNVLQDAMNRYNQGQYQPWDSLGQYANIIQGVPSSLGTQYTQGQNVQGSPISGAIGGGLAGYAAGGWPGAVVGGIGGLL